MLLDAGVAVAADSFGQNTHANAQASGVQPTMRAAIMNHALRRQCKRIRPLVLAGLIVALVTVLWVF